MTDQQTKLGKVYILPQAIKTVVKHAALQSYGVISLAPANVCESASRFFQRDADFGIKVSSDKEGLYIEINLIIEYGVRIKSVTDSVADSIRYNVEKTMGVPVKRVDVHVRGLRISSPD